MKKLLLLLAFISVVPVSAIQASKQEYKRVSTTTINVDRGWLGQQVTISKSEKLIELPLDNANDGLSDTEAVGMILGGIAGNFAGRYVDQSFAKRYFDSLRKQYQYNPEYLKEIAKLEFNRAVKFAPRRAILRVLGVYGFAWLGSELGSCLHKK